MDKRAIWAGIPAIWLLAAAAAYTLLTAPAPDRPSVPHNTEQETTVAAVQQSLPLEPLIAGDPAHHPAAQKAITEVAAETTEAEVPPTRQTHRRVRPQHVETHPMGP